MTTPRLTDATRTNMATTLRQWGIENTHREVFDALHEEAVEAVDTACQDYAIGYDDLDPDDREFLILAYKDGFWEPTHKLERDELKAHVEGLSARLSDMIFSAPAAPDGRFPEMFVPRVPTLSTSHMTREDADRLHHHYQPSAMLSSSDGALLHIHNCSDPEEEYAEFSEAFRNIILRLVEAGYSYVRFDSCHEPIASFPTFDW
jgi:hypothetical protein